MGFSVRALSPPVRSRCTSCLFGFDSGVGMSETSGASARKSPEFHPSLPPHPRRQLKEDATQGLGRLAMEGSRQSAVSTRSERVPRALGNQAIRGGERTANRDRSRDR